jgi:AcrR family transcriptional regulator
MRERYRAHVRHEVKQAALRQLAESGPAAVSISAIGKQLGMSGPALYRYFASRGELLTELTIDAYHDLADALGAAAGRAPGRDARARLEELGRAYRSGALAQATGTGCCSGRHCPATTPTLSGSWRRRRPPWPC